MNDLITVVGCLVMVVVALGALRWGWRQPKTFVIYRDGEQDLHLTTGSIYKVNTDCIKFDNLQLKGISWNRVLLKDLQMGFEVTTEFRSIPTENRKLVVTRQLTR